MSRLRHTVASWSDRDDVVVELARDEDDLGHLAFDRATGRIELILYPAPSGSDWQLDLDEFQDLLTRARCRLMEVAGPVAAG
jgi:hypothetical protein